ncbi:DTW domain-containing protein 1 [Smittium mucronatum]|uniref:tRNA-uridine aminocarboxypropyltransferase 1 n=1 Tax=Smittium mucronatum TaxID=133383 RepID=A0A1R0GUG2_9FUNG|nr:DTW domain-containing protein 1 [Smittium mucronatum]
MSEAVEYDLEAIETYPERVLTPDIGREKCQGCQKLCKFYCYECYVAMPSIRDLIPKIELPLHLFVIKHFQELNGKSTAIHAKILANDSTTIHSYPSEDWLDIDASTCLLLYPGKDAVTMESLVENKTLDKYKNIIVIDGTWKQARGMLSPQMRQEHLIKHNKTIKDLLLNAQKVSIKPRKTKFWRHQTMGESHLATIEAIYFLYKEYTEASKNAKNDNIDDLMFFFKYYYNVVQKNYIENRDKKYTTKHSTDYIKYK